MLYQRFVKGMFRRTLLVLGLRGDAPAPLVWNNMNPVRRESVLVGSFENCTIDNSHQTGSFLVFYASTLRVYLHEEASYLIGTSASIGLEAARYGNKTVYGVYSEEYALVLSLPILNPALVQVFQYKWIWAATQRNSRIYWPSNVPQERFFFGPTLVTDFVPYSGAFNCSKF